MNKYFTSLYQRTMCEAYERAHAEIFTSLDKGGKCLDCGSQSGHKYTLLKNELNYDAKEYFGIEWNHDLVRKAQETRLNITQGDLNNKLSFVDKEFTCVFALSVLEHLLYPCSFLKECYRVLDDEGTLAILTPNISTYFTAFTILLGKMPSSGPHPDSSFLVNLKMKVEEDEGSSSQDSDNPIHRHLVVFSYRVLKRYLKRVGFKSVKGYGFGVYPFPNLIQPIIERLDPYHAHQMVFIAKK